MRWSSYDASNDEVARLKRELARTREAILGLAPEKFRFALFGYLSCESRDEGYQWKARLVDSLIEGAEILSSYSGFSDRANCPLCGYGGQGPYVDGLTVPEGLRRHLTGWGNMQQCSIMDATMRLANEHWDEKFREAELAERKAELAELQRRKESETLYKVSPYSDPELANSGYRREARNQEEMAWAEERLISLGFKVQSEARVKSYLDERADYVVYADPRRKGEISFTVYKLPLKKRRGRVPVWDGVSRFSLADSWKNDLQGKYQKRVDEAVKTLAVR